MRTSTFIILVVAVIAASSATCAFAQATTAPLCLFINGGGSVSSLTNAQLLVVGQSYKMVAIPDAGFAFSSWQPVNVFTVTTTVLMMNETYTNVSVSAVPVPTYTDQPALNFVMQPVDVIQDSPGLTMTMSSGWQANFEPMVLNIAVGDSAVVLTWTNWACSLQTALAPSGAYTNVLGAGSPYTNNSSAPAQYFRLISN